MAVAGQLGKTSNAEIISVDVAAATTITKGDVVTFSSGNAIVATTTENPRITGRGVAIETVANAGAAGAKQVRICRAGDVYVTAGAAIVANSYLAVDATAGRVATATIAALADVGKWLDAIYLGHEGEEANPTDAADNDVILIRLL